MHAEQLLRKFADTLPPRRGATELLTEVAFSASEITMSRLLVLAWCPKVHGHKNIFEIYPD